jgi:hypothetical protein
MPEMMRTPVIGFVVALKRLAHPGSIVCCKGDRIFRKFS